MIAILLSSLLFIICLIYTFSTIPKSKKIIAKWSPNHEISPSAKITTKSDQNHLKKNVNTKSESLRSVFATFDKNRDGLITKQELRDSLRNIGISAGEKDVADMVEKVDSNGDGLIDFDEFCELFQSISGGRKLEEAGERDGELREAFNVFDENGDGLITVEELGLVLSSLGFNEGTMVENCKEMIEKVDVDGDGMVNFDEFKTMMRDRNLGRMISVS